jgi:hypothetical protein
MASASGRGHQHHHKAALQPYTTPATVTPSSGRSTITNILILLPFVSLFFVCGVWIGSQFVSANDSAALITPISASNGLGLPGTNNVFKRWDSESSASNSNSKSKPNGILDRIKGNSDIHRIAGSVGQNLRGGGEGAGPDKDKGKDGAVPSDQPPDLDLLMKGKSSPDSPSANSRRENIKFDDDESKSLADKLKSSLHTTRSAYMTATQPFDSPEILIGAWIYMDAGSIYDTGKNMYASVCLYWIRQLKTLYPLCLRLWLWLLLMCVAN